MPVVFVHGVNNRYDKEYEESMNVRNGFIREILLPALNLDPVKVKLLSPYWGADGASFAWNMAVLPDPNKSHQAMGTDQNNTKAEENLSLTIATSELDPNKSIVENARVNIDEVVDILYASASANPKSSESEARELASSYLTVTKYLESDPDLVWLNSSTDETFIDDLNYQASATQQVQAMGTGGLRDSLLEGVDRFKNAIPAVTSGALGKIFREKINSNVATFAGDAFTYLSRRGDETNPGKIVEVVRDALKEAIASKTEGDDKLYVIAHSFGGEIVYDILTYFDKTIVIDCLVTVGSQVGLFEEMKLYVTSQKGLPGPNSTKVTKPINIKKWLNVYDLNDVLAYCVEPVFSDTSDFEYNTGFSTLGAHGGYFVRPSFYKRLAVRLSAS